MTDTELESTSIEIDADYTDAARAAIMGARSAMAGRHGAALRRRRDHAAGRGGIPDVSEDASEELRDIARVSRLNMCGVVRDTFARGLSVVGFRSPSAQDDDPAWAWWQAHRLDARQRQVYKHSLTYGEAFVSVLPDDRMGDPARPVIWSPLSVMADYEEPGDLFPSSAILMRHTAEGVSVLMVDSTHVTTGIVRIRRKGDGSRAATRMRDIEIIGEPWEHGATYGGAPVCPVVRFLDESSDDGDRGVGVVEPAIDLNRAMNQVNFDRLVVARYGAHDQKIIIGWTAPKDHLARLSAAHIGAIDEHPNDVRIDRWQASPLGPYNELISELREQVALELSIPLWAAGNISNVSTDTAAMIEAAHQRELQAKRDGLGESWEQVIRLAVAMSGGPQPSESAEVIWRETQARAFGAVVDGVTKLAQAGVPIEELLDMIPGMTQQRMNAIRQALKRSQGAAALASILQGPADVEG